MSNPAPSLAPAVRFWQDAGRRATAVHFCILGGEGDGDFVRALAKGLAGKGWEAFHRGDVLAGGDPAAEEQSALERAGCLVVVTREAMGADGRSVALAALEQRKRNPAARVVPVCRGTVDLNLRNYAHLNILHALRAPDPGAGREAGAGEVVRELDRIGGKIGLRLWGEQRVRIGVVAVRAELGEVADRVIARLGALPQVVRDRVERIDPGEEGAADRLAGLDLRVLLLGARHGGGLGVLGRLVEDALDPWGARTVVVRVAYDPDELAPAWVGEQEEVLPLRRRFAGSGSKAVIAGEAPDTVVSGVLDWHRRAFPPDPGASRVLETWEKEWLEHKAGEWRCGDAGGLATLLGKKSDRARWFVNLHSGAPWREVKGRPVRLRERVEGPPGKRGEKEESRPAWMDAVLSLPDHPRVAVVGSAGAGKSVLLQHVAWVLARHALGQPAAERGEGEEEHHLDLAALRGRSPVLPVPVLHSARTLARHLCTAGGDPGRAVGESLVALLCSADTFGDRADPEAVRQGLARGRYLLLVDSLDEVPDAKGRQAVVTALGALGALGARVVLTTRPAAHTDVDLPEGFVRADIAPLDDGRIERLVTVWMGVYAPGEEAGPPLAAVRATQADFPTDAENRSPAENPLLLTCMLLVYLDHRRLPDDRAELYYEMTRLLCERRVDAGTEDEKKAGAGSLRESLQAVFRAMQEEGGARLPLAEAGRALHAAGKAKGAREGEDEVDRLAARTGLLRFEGTGSARVVRPWHRSFQEYLAARSIAAEYVNRQEECLEWLSDGRGERGSRLADPSWTGCLRFLVGAFGHVDGEHAVACVKEWLAGARPGDPLEARLLALAAGGVAEYEARHFRTGPVREELRREIAGRFKERGGRWPWEDRLDALEALGRLGDPRLPDPREVREFGPETGWVRVPGGEYEVGEKDGESGALPRGLTRTPDLWVRVWPVTVAEYRAFVDDGGYTTPRWWVDGGTGLVGPTPVAWYQQVRRPNGPATGVSSWEARAFSRWATERWGLPALGPIDLPTSREWEVIARRGTGRPYPWGDPTPGDGDGARAAHDWGGDPFYGRRGAPVGAFPAGHSPEGLWDLAGNVWEWCATAWMEGGEEADRVLEREEVPAGVAALRGGAGPRQARHGSAAREHGVSLGDKERRMDDTPRVLRGGSWGGDPWWLRAAVRFGYLPRYRDELFGFRVVCRSPEPR